jgi:hypothetical protein
MHPKASDSSTYKPLLSVQDMHLQMHEHIIRASLYELTYGKKTDLNKKST